ncbi:MAG: DegQ family serine endoprotease [Candidatus Acidiferrum sp.]
MSSNLNLVRSTKFKIFSVTVLCGLLVAAGAMVGQTSHLTAKAAPSKVEAPIFASPSKSAPAAAPLAASYAPIIKDVLPEVVNISSSRVVHRSEQDPSSMFDDPFFRQFFGNRRPRSQQPQSEKEQSLGSGVIVGTNGYIITNNHVVDGATDIKVSMSDKRELTAKVVGKDPKTDIAILKVDADHLPAIPLGDSSKVQVGDLAFAIGDPFGIGKTVTMGIISATGRAVGILNDGGYEDFIQTDAAINPGNSGGALIDSKGELIGINTAILSGGGGGNQGVGFAVPVNLAKQVMDQIIEHGSVVRGFLGATIQDVTPTMAKALGLSQSGGVLIGDVSPKGPAATAGIKPGDVVVKMNGEPVTDWLNFRLHISQSAPGTTVPLTIRRGSDTLNMNVKLGELPTDHEAKDQEGAASGQTSSRGMQVEALTPAARQQLNLGDQVRGVVVSQVDPSSPAATAGVREGDVVVEVNHKPVNSVSEFDQAMRAAEGKAIALRVNREGRGFYVAIDPS